jgi:hypothetical protein
VAVECRGEFDTTALHVACRNHPPADVVEAMLRAAPDMIFWADSFGWLPVSCRCPRVNRRSFVGPFPYLAVYSFRRAFRHIFISFFLPSPPPRPCDIRSSGRRKKYKNNSSTTRAPTAPTWP